MLTLPNDRALEAAILHSCLPAGKLGGVIDAIASALPAIAARLAAGKLPGDPAALCGKNESGDAQKALDVGAHNHMLAVLQGRGVRHMLSEEAEAVELLVAAGKEASNEAAAAVQKAANDATKSAKKAPKIFYILRVLFLW